MEFTALNGADSSEWDSDPEDDSGAVLRTVGGQIKGWRTRAGMTRIELGAAVGYSDEMVSAVERGRRAPSPVFLDKADEVLDAGGIVAAMKKDVATARYPKKVRDLAKVEAAAVEMGAYHDSVVPGLLQTEDYTRALFSVRRPQLAEGVIERQVGIRQSRQEILHNTEDRPFFSFVLDEVVLRRRPGGRTVQRRQLEQLLEIGQLRNVDIQVIPSDREEHGGLHGGFRVFKFRDGTTLGYLEIQHVSRLISQTQYVQLLEMQYGNIRAQALAPRESRAFIEKVLGEE